MEKVYLSNKTFLSDLCARALYHPRVHVVDKITKEEYDDWLTFANFTEYANIRYELKLYLRPMSSMTEGERKEIGILIRENRPNPYGIINNNGVDNLLFSVSVTSRLLIDWLNAHHFDHRGLIPMGFAIEVTKDNNPYEEE